MGVEQLTKCLYRLSCGRFQAYVWRDTDSVTLIDTGTADCGGDIALALDEIGLAPTDLGRVILTHFHDDHAGSAAEIRDWDEVTVVAHPADAAVLEGAMPGPEPVLRAAERELFARLVADVPPAPPVTVDLEVDDGDVLDFGGGAEVLSVPGHTAGSIALYLPRHGVLLAGDAAAEHLGQVMLANFNVDPAAAVQSLRRLAGLEVELAAFGHGEPVLHDATARLREAAQAATAG